jgi:predicted  nucleic acid-binding Zn-ribbon protein
VDLAPREQPLNAAAETQLRLLELQDKDTRLNQLAHKARTLPESTRLAEVDARLSRLRDEVVAAETIASDLEHEQEKADQDVEQVRERTRRDQQLLDSGTIGDPKQLQSIQSELQSLARRQGDLEDVELEIMERVEGARAAVVQLTGDRDAVAGDRAELAAQVDALLAGITAERIAVEADREAIVQSIPADLLGLYDKIRADHGGVGAAPLHRGRCQGCRMELPPNEIEAIREAPADKVIRCEECRRILVRTPESGL